MFERKLKKKHNILKKNNVSCDFEIKRKCDVVYKKNCRCKIKNNNNVLKKKHKYDVIHNIEIGIKM